VAALLLVGALLVAVAERRRLRDFRRSTLFRRVFSWALIAPVFGLGVFLGGPVLILLVGYLVFQSLREFTHLAEIRNPYAALLHAFGYFSIVVIALQPLYFPFLPVLFFLILTLVPILSGKLEGSFRQISAALFAYIYLPFLLGFFVLIERDAQEGTAILLLVAMSVALSDVVAFTCGKLLGHIKLVPLVSPNKTWAGAFGNFIGAYLGFALMAFAIPARWPVWLWLGLPALIAVASLWGDLLESVVKRSFQAKDAGTMLPGFGGLLDRIDSLILAMPLTYFAVRLLS
jgi:phosphatidate cytidylyltransferase